MHRLYQSAPPFGENGNQIPGACREGYIANLRSGKYYLGTVQGIPASWAQEHGDTLIEAINHLGKSASAYILTPLMEGFIKSKLPSYNSPDASEPPGTLCGEFFFHRAMDRQLSTLNAILDLFHGFPPNSDTKSHLELLFVMVSKNLALLSNHTKVTRRDGLEYLTLRSTTCAPDSRSTKKVTRTEFLHQCITNYLKIGKFLNSQIQHIQELADVQLRALSELLHESLNISQCVARLIFYHSALKYKGHLADVTPQRAPDEDELSLIN